MSWFPDIRGTMSAIFRIGKRGPQLKNNGGTIEARNTGDSAFVNVSGLDPTLDDHLITKRHFDANNAAAQGINVVKVVVAQATVISAGTIPVGAIIHECRVRVLTPYNGTTPTLAVSVTGAGTIMAADKNDIETGFTVADDIYEDVGHEEIVTSAKTITCTLAGTGITVGDCEVEIEYTTPVDITT